MIKTAKEEERKPNELINALISSHALSCGVIFTGDKILASASDFAKDKINSPPTPDSHMLL